MKGIGEAGTIAATPAVVSAVCDALGVRDLDMPLQPETVWSAIAERRRGVIPRAFEYERPESVADAAASCARTATGARVIAGGHSLLPMMKLRLAAPEMLIDIAGISSCAASATRARTS